MGRTSKLTKGVHKVIVEALASGCYRETAAEHAGISTSTFYRWMEQGEADLEHDVASPYRDFWEAIKKAEADAEVKAIKLIRAAAEEPRTWQAAAWLLERKKPAQWGRRTSLEHSGKIDTGDSRKLANVIQAIFADVGIDLTDEEIREKVRVHLDAAAHDE